MNDAERRIKHERVAGLLEAEGLDAVLLTRRCNFSWYTCGAANHVATAADAGASTLVVDRAGACVLANNIESPRLREEEFAGSGIEVLEYPYADASARQALFEKVAGRRRAAADVPVPGVEAEPLPPAFDRLRWVLLPAEIERYRAVCRDTVAAVEDSARAAGRGETEHVLAARLSAALAERGLRAWVLLVAADERVARFRHPLPTARRAEKYFLLATCAERHGLIAACTRLASFGRPGADLERRHRAVATVEAALLTATRPGATLGSAFAEAQAAYAAAGFPDEWRRHHQGGSIGYLPREAKASPGDAMPILEDQAFAWNPSVAGTKGEDTVLCRPEGGVPLAPEGASGPTDWPTVRAEWKERAMDRPAILVR
jgi:Xaa-Pro aminopeptidase